MISLAGTPDPGHRWIARHRARDRAALRRGRGADVAITYHTRRADAEDVARAIRGLGPARLRRRRRPDATPPR